MVVRQRWRVGLVCKTSASAEWIRIPRLSHSKFINLEMMSKVEKKRKKIQERIDFLETEMRTELTKKTSNTKEINVPSYQRKIQDLKVELSNLK